MDKKKRAWIFVLIMTAIVVVDQIVKILVKTNMQIGEDIPLIGEWCRLHFIENEGFAFGATLGGTAGKIILTLFRIVAISAIIWYLVRLMKKEDTRTSFLACISLILAGAVGNLIDSCFYGVVFNESYYEPAVLFPPEGGYAPLLQGKVVDMFYFPLWTWPDWVPLVGGDIFFEPVFNFADSCVTVGAIYLILFQWKFFSKEE